MPDLKLELEPSPRMAKLASFELELEYSSRPGVFSHADWKSGQTTSHTVMRFM